MYVIASYVLIWELIEEVESFIDNAVFMKDGKILREFDTETLRMQEGKSIADLYRELM